MEPNWLTFDAVVGIHDLAVNIQGSHGFPQPTYLESALFAPRQTYHYSNGGVDLFDLAAVYLYHIAKAHAFTDANKRTAYGAALVFLGINDVLVLLPPNVIALAEATVELAKDQIGKPEVAALMRAMPTGTLPE